MQLTDLPRRQCQIAARAARGIPNQDIARELGITEGTVKAQLHVIYRKFRVRNRTGLMWQVLTDDAA